MTNIAIWKIPNHKWRYLAGKIIYFYGPWLNHGYVSHNQRVYPIIIPFFTIVNPLLNHEKSPFIVVKYPIRSHVNPMYHLVMTNIAIENPPIF